MTTLFGGCALVGGAVLICQFLMSVFGLADHHDLDVEHDFGADGHDVPHGGHGAEGGDDVPHEGTWFFGVITFRTVVAAVTFFGLVGLAANAARLSPFESFAAATAGGTAAMFGVHQAMRQLHRLRSDGTLRVERAVGRAGTAYVRIPARGAGRGKVVLTIQDRTVELEAITDGDEIPTGTRVLVSEVISPDAVRVERVPTTQEVSRV